MATKKQQDLNLEQCLARLDEIADIMNSRLPLSEALDLYKEGAQLIDKAKKLLENAQAEIKVITDKNGFSDKEETDE